MDYKPPYNSHWEINMRTIKITIDEPLLEEVDRLTATLNTTRSAFIHNALQAAIRKHSIALLEEQDAQGYVRYPAEPGEVEEWLTEQAWGDE
jgi:metal-responsive CopG/Arc/MetJ family transcriptional regulator